MNDTFLEWTGYRFGRKVQTAAARILAAMDLPDPETGEYLRGTEANMLFLDRYGIILRVGEAGNAPEHDLILRPLHSVRMKDANKEAISISILPGVEGVARSAEDSVLISDTLAADGINFWDAQLPNCGYIRRSLPGFENGVPVVVDRGAVRVVPKENLSWFRGASKKAFNNAVLAGLQEKVFAPFLDKLDECVPKKGTSGWEAVKSFLYRCAHDIHQGEKSILTNQWNKNGGGYCKPSMVTDMAKKYETRLKQRDHDRCQFYATLPFVENAPPKAKPQPAQASTARAAVPA